MTSAQQPIIVRVTRVFTAAPERVFDAWLDPALLGQWMFGPSVREEEIVHIETDPRVGGSFSFLVRRHGQEIDHVGEYRAIDRPLHLAFTWGLRENLPESSLVKVDITPTEAGCELTVIHEMNPKWADFAYRVQGGWTHMLQMLAKSLS